MKTSLFSGAAEAGDELRDCFAGPHAELGRAGDTPQPRPAGARLPARGENDPAETEARHQISPEEVCSSPQCSAVAGLHVVRGTAGLQTDEHDPAGEEDHDVLKLRHPDESSNKCPNILQRDHV